MVDGSSVGFSSTDEVAVESVVSECGRFMEVEEEEDVVEIVFCWCFWLSVVQVPGVCVCFVMFVYGCVWQFVEHTDGVVFWNVEGFRLLCAKIKNEMRVA